MTTPKSSESGSEVIAKVKCQDCGFLAWRNNHTRELAEVELSYRQSGTFECSNVQRLFEPNPVCFCLAFDIRNEVSSKTSVLDVISRERNCHGFVSWQHGMTPKEHLEMTESESVPRLKVNGMQRCCQAISEHSFGRF